MLLVLREQGLRLIVSYRRVNDNIVTLFPIHWRRDAVLITDLESYIKVRQ